MRRHNPQISGSLSVFGTVGNESYIVGTNVGIGTNNPGYPLHVLKSNSANIAWLENTHASGVGLTVDVAGTGVSEEILRLRSDGGTNEIMVAMAGGNVGINTIAPSQPLTVAGNISGIGN